MVEPIDKACHPRIEQAQDTSVIPSSDDIPRMSRYSRAWDQESENPTRGWLRRGFDGDDGRGTAHARINVTSKGRAPLSIFGIEPEGSLNQSR